MPGEFSHSDLSKIKVH